MKKINLTLLFCLFLSFSVFAGYKVGDKATDFSLKNTDGKMVSMNQMKNAKGFIVVFTCNHCPFSIAYEDRIIALNEKYASKGYPVIAINPNDEVREPGDSYDKMIVRAKEKKFTFPYLRDQDQSIATTYGATRTPHVYILEKSGSDLIVRYIGAIDNNADEPEKADSKFVENAVESLLSGKSVSNPETKAIGCTIKWKQ